MQCVDGRGSREEAFYWGRRSREEVFYKDRGSREEVFYKEQFLCVELYFGRRLVLVLWISDPSQGEPLYLQ